MRCVFITLTVMLFISVTRAKSIELKDAIVSVNAYYNSNGIKIGELKRIVDGDTSQNFNQKCIAAVRGTTGEAWFQIDMLQEVTVDSVELLTRSDSGNQLSYFKIYISKKTETDDTNLCAQENGMASNQEFVKYDCEAALRGRYLTIISTAQYLSLCEVKVNASNTESSDTYVDLKDATIKTGKTFGGSPAERMLDGDTSQSFGDKCIAIYANINQEVAWLEIDMGEISSVGSIELLARGDQYGPNQLKNIEIYVAQKDEISEENFCAQAGNNAVTTEFNIYPCVKQLSGRYIFIRKVNAESNNFLSLCEVRINTQGSKKDSDNQIDLVDAVVAVSQYYYSNSLNVRELKRIVDGNNNQDFNLACIAAQRYGTGGTWFQIDLLKEYTITSLQLLGRGNEQQLGNFEIFLSKESDTEPDRLCAKQVGEADNTKFVEFECEKALNTRYITIRGTALYMTICELKAFGTLVEKSDTYVDLTRAEVTASRLYNNYLGERIVNSDTSQSYDTACTAASPTSITSKEAYFQIDMKDDATDVGSVEILARRDQNGAMQLKNFEIYVAKREDIDDSNLCTKVGDSASINEFNIYPCDIHRRGRYLTIRKLRNGHDEYIAICELRVNKKGAKKGAPEEGNSGSTGGRCVRRMQCGATTMTTKGVQTKL